MCAGQVWPTPGHTAAECGAVGSLPGGKGGVTTVIGDVTTGLKLISRMALQRDRIISGMALQG